MIRSTGSQEEKASRDSLDAAIAQVEAELDAALDGLDGWAEDVLNSEQHRLEELRSAWKAQADRIRQIDRLLAAPATSSDPLADVAADVAKARQSEETPPRQHPATRGAAQPNACRPRRHARLGPRAGDDDPPGQVQRSAGGAGRGARRPNRRRGAGAFGSERVARAGRSFDGRRV